MKRPETALCLLALAACQHRPSEREIAVAAPCIRAADLPAPVPAAGPLPDDARQASDLLGAVVLKLRANERILRALIAPCTLERGVTNSMPR